MGLISRVSGRTYRYSSVKMVRFHLIGAAFAAVCALVAAQDEMKIEKVVENDCERRAAHGDKLSMHYRGKLTDGTEFDASYNRNQPFDFDFGATCDQRLGRGSQGHV